MLPGGFPDQDKISHWDLLSPKLFLSHLTAMEIHDNSVLTLWELAFLITMLILLLSFLFQAKGAVAGLLQKQPGAEATDITNLMVKNLKQQIQ